MPPSFHKGDMFEKAEGLTRDLDVRVLLLFTANSYVNQRGELVMGRGAALEAAKRWPHLREAFGQAIPKRGSEYGIQVFRDVFHFGVNLEEHFIDVGAFQVKTHFKNQADTKIIRRSAMLLTWVAQCYDYVVMNYPGIGYGRLSKPTVEPLLQCLPENVVICEQ